MINQTENMLGQSMYELFEGNHFFSNYNVWDSDGYIRLRLIIGDEKSALLDNLEDLLNALPAKMAKKNLLKIYNSIYMLSPMLNMEFLSAMVTGIKDFFKQQFSEKYRKITEIGLYDSNFNYAKGWKNL